MMFGNDDNDGDEARKNQSFFLMMTVEMTDDGHHYSGDRLWI